MEDAQFDRLVGEIYDAALEPSRWEGVLVHVADRIGAVGGNYFVADAQQGRLAFSVAGRLPQEGERDYVRHYHRVDPNTCRALAGPPGRWYNNAEYHDAAYVGRSAYYQDFLIPNGSRWIIGCFLAVDDALASVVAFHRDVAGQAFGDGEARFLQRLTGHLQRAAHLMHKTLALQGQAGLGGEILGRLGLPLLVCDGFGVLRYANPAAEAILGEGDGVALAKGRLLAAREPMALAGMLDDACAHGRGGALALPRPGRRPLQATVVPLAPDSRGLNPWQESLALVLFADPERQPIPPAEHLAALYRFTPAEARLAQALLQGVEAAEYAQVHRLSLATVRSQLRALLAKTGTRRQAELVRLLGALPSLAPAHAGGCEFA